jgi:hypothetical protein
MLKLGHLPLLRLDVGQLRYPEAERRVIWALKLTP